jgi:hypothetical protein
MRLSNRGPGQRVVMRTAGPISNGDHLTWISTPRYRPPRGQLGRLSETGDTQPGFSKLLAPIDDAGYRRANRKDLSC